MEAPDMDRKEVRRPMNAFLIFCKRHRTMVREKNPNLDNRSVTRILGDLWANLQEEEKSQYTDLAKQYKDAFMKANPDYKWHNPDRLGHVPPGKPLTRPSNIRLGRDDSDLPLEGSIVPGKLADPSNMGGLSNLLMAGQQISQRTSVPKPSTTVTSLPSGTSLLDLAEMCSSELHEDKNMSRPQGYTFDTDNQVLDLTTKKVESSDQIKNLTNTKGPSDPGRVQKCKDYVKENQGVGGWGSRESDRSSVRPENGQSMSESGRIKTENGRSRNESGRIKQENAQSMSECRGSKEENGQSMSECGQIKQENGRSIEEKGRSNKENGQDKCDKNMMHDGRDSPSLTSGKVIMDHIIEKLYTHTEDRKLVNTDKNNGKVAPPWKSDLATAPQDSGIDIKPQISKTNGTKTAMKDDHRKSNYASFLLKKSSDNHMNDELARGDNFSGRKRCYSETSVDIYADNFSGKRLHRMLTGEDGDVTTVTADQSASPSHDQDFGDGENDDGSHPVRKSKRRNRGQRYQELINEGIIQPSKERLAVIKNETETSKQDQDSSEEETVARPVGDLAYDVLSVYPRQIRKRTCSESEKTRSIHEDIQRYKTGDFDLEAHIATLPACSLEKVSRNAKRPANKVRSMSESCGKYPNPADPGFATVPEVVLTVPPHLKPKQMPTGPVTGSQRRKARKHSVTHLQVVKPDTTVAEKGKSKDEDTIQNDKNQMTGNHGDGTKPNVCDTKLDVIESDRSKVKPMDQSEMEKKNSPNLVDNVQSSVIKCPISIDKCERSVSESSDQKDAGNSMSACNMIDNILVSLSDSNDNLLDCAKTKSGDEKISSVHEVCGTDPLVHSSVAVTSPSVLNNRKTSIESINTSSEQKVEVSENPCDMKTETLSAELIGDCLSCPTECAAEKENLATNQNLVTKSKDGLLGAYLINRENTSTTAAESDSSDFYSPPCDNSAVVVAREDNSVNSTSDPVLYDNSSSDERSDIKTDTSNLMDLSTEGGGGVTITPAGSSFIPDVSGQEYSVIPPKPVAVVNS